MINEKDEYSNRSSWPVPEINRTPLERLIAREEANVALDKNDGWGGLDAETAIFLADFSARFPDKWPTIREYIRNGRANRKELALRLRISQKTVKRHLQDLRRAGREWLARPAGELMVRYEADTGKTI
ncbi:MAG: winged helix-turn-helix domain-containing protein [Victivallaceae bacterium]|nr:winged helix-turn-helix domain-containing protein [Victivallaceae bacterium]